MSRFRIAALSRSALWQRWTAFGAMGLVLMLNLLAAAPQVHVWLHETGRALTAETADHSHRGHRHDAGALPAANDDATCIVTQFASGQVGCDAAPAVLVTVDQLTLATLVDTGAIFAGTTDLLLPPGCGPPLA